MINYSIKVLENALKLHEAKDNFVNSLEEELNLYRIKDLKDNIRILKQITEE